MNSKIKKIFSDSWPALQSFIIEQLKGAIVKKALKTFLKSGAGVGFQGWLIKFVAEEFAEEIAEPVLKALFVEGKYILYKVDGKMLIKKLEEAKENNDVEAYNSTVDDILS